MRKYTCKYSRIYIQNNMALNAHNKIKLITFHSLLLLQQAACAIRKVVCHLIVRLVNTSSELPYPATISPAC
jgi:hypothetical protein